MSRGIFFGPPTDPIQRIGNANFAELYSMYGLSVGSGGGNIYYVATTGSASNTGLSWDSPLLTVQAAVNLCTAYGGDLIVVGPGSYAEDVTIPVAQNGLTIIGAGNRGEASVRTLLVRADDVTLINLGVAAGDAAAYALKFTGDRFRARACKFEGAVTSGIAALAASGTAAQVAAGTDGSAADFLIEDCESAWTDKGFVCQSSDYGAVTQGYLRGHRFHNCTTVCLGENDAGSIGAVRNLVVQGCVFDNAENGTAPTDYVDLNTTNCTGIITGCSFATATNAATVLQIAAGVMWVGNITEAGVSTARPA